MGCVPGTAARRYSRCVTQPVVRDGSPRNESEYAAHESAGKVRTPNQPSHASERGRTPSLRSILNDAGHAAHNSEELVLRQRQVIMETRVAARDDGNADGVRRAVDASMHDELTVADEHYNLAGSDVGEIHRAYGDRIARPHRWQHAGSANMKAQCGAGG